MKVNVLRAIGLMLGAMAFLAVSDVFIKLASQRAPLGQVMVSMSLGGTALFLALAAIKRVRIFTADALHPMVLLRNAFEIVGGLGLIVGISKVPLSVFAAIMQAAPLVVTLGAALFLREEVGWRRWTAIAVGLVGMLLVIRPFGAEFSGWELFAVMGVVGLAARDLVTRLSPESIPSLAISTWGFMAIIVPGLALLIFEAKPMTAEPLALVYIAAMVVVTALGYLCVTTAMRLAPAAIVSPFRYTRLVFTTGLGMAVFGERPGLPTLAGGALILAAGLYTFARERRLAIRTAAASRPAAAG
ncbi:DMT family transporter [Citreimonas sp.]|uniref:DMT family transporter n=1 Tax=Citreimonas sp. TaxID=3036715 RepID=UPI004057F4A5